MAELLQLGALWKKTSKDGKLFFSGKVNSEISILVFENIDKKKDGANPSLPDYKIFLSKTDKSKIQNKTTPETGSTTGVFQNDYLADDDIPF